MEEGRKDAKIKGACSEIQMRDVLEEHKVCNLFKILCVNNDSSVKTFLSHISSAQILTKLFLLLTVIN